ncbi:hypothetical protein DKT68_21325 [Micromonospora acroterricola]|uniref:Uncharacterized protein n=1 Tax=Micromonospora acroterricola TaxID=2202421 RepID=A0A317CY65_9ACTN|nr:hypothetical protein [Micromonospora acroterricola]PWR06790.1 hypothetical protein DKT68_21325 [Micromonospora acroterricola]
MNWLPYQDTADWGSVPDWFGAVGSIVSVLIVYLGLRREIRARRTDELRGRATQARLVSAVAEIRGNSVLRVVVANESDAPVLDVTVLPLLVPPDDPEGTPTELAGAKQVRRIHGRESQELFVTVTAEHRLRAADAVLVDLTFTDHDGNRWRRSGAGQPEAVG